ncbi:MAG: hypothetical protein H7281_16115 [Bacteriovorax sp.]|nr:hypothetical protein [Bacteriovorax sp.]
MERVKDSLLFWSLTLGVWGAIIFYLLYHNLLGNSSTRGIFYSFILFLTPMYSFNLVNKSKTDGIFLSEKKIVFTGENFEVEWKNLNSKVVRKRFFKRYVLLQLQCISTNKHIEFALFYDSGKSFCDLVEKYAPRDHQLLSIVRDYRNGTLK